MTKYLNEWSNTAGSNNATVPDGWPEGMTSNQINNTARETLAVISRWEKDNNGTVVTSGTQPAYTATLNQSSIAAYYDGLRVCLDFHATNAGGAPTLDLNSIGAAKALVWPDGTALVANDITADMKLDLMYDGTSFQVLSARGVPGVPAANSIDGTMIAIGSDATGDMLYYDGTDYALIAAGTDGYHLRAKGAAAPVWEAVDATPRSYLAGLTLSNDTDTAHDINVTAGVCKTADGLSTMTLSTEQTKQIDAPWATGDDAGGLSSSITLSTGTPTWYHVHVFLVGSTVEVGFDTSVTAANLIADHGGTAGKYRRIGSVLTDTTNPGNIEPFFQFGDDFIWDAAVQDYSANPGGSGEKTTILSVPTGVEVAAQIIGSGWGSSTADTLYHAVYYPGITTPTATAHRSFTFTQVAGAAGGAAGSTIYVRTDTSAQVQHRAETANTTSFTIQTVGWRDDRGRAS